MRRSNDKGNVREISVRESAKETSANGSEAVNIVPGIWRHRQGLANRKPQGLSEIARNTVAGDVSSRYRAKTGLKEIGESRGINFVDLRSPAGKRGVR